jgi:hypothetical protein
MIDNIEMIGGEGQDSMEWIDVALVWSGNGGELL